LRSAFGAGSLPDERDASVALDGLSDGLVALELGVVELLDGMLLVAAGVEVSRPGACVVSVLCDDGGLALGAVASVVVLWADAKPMAPTIAVAATALERS